MSGINSTEKNYKYGSEFLTETKDFSYNYNFKLYSNTHSTTSNTANAVPFILNFETNKPSLALRNKYIKKTNITYNEYDLIKNKLFDKFESVSVIQNIHLNFCDNQNVKKCYQIDP